MAQHNVIVYSTPTCGYCNIAKKQFNEKGIKYKDIDVSADQEAAMEMVRKSGQMGVPVFEIDGKILVGYQPAMLEKLLQ
ncbi:MAG: glutathione S-transferase N-terminal domain-containing protein [Candidatus Doudnabacteria bacterium]|nr:glutathione S-transferase N-terminal domain-containing protein [Candidatus Doudnabacteria bacterium]